MFRHTMKQFEVCNNNCACNKKWQKYTGTLLKSGRHRVELSLLPPGDESRQSLTIKWCDSVTWWRLLHSTVSPVADYSIINNDSLPWCNDIVPNFAVEGRMRWGLTQVNLTVPCRYNNSCLEHTHHAYLALDTPLWSVVVDHKWSNPAHLWSVK